VTGYCAPRMRSLPSAASGGEVPPVKLGKYALLGAIGRGGMADVYLAIAHGPSGVRKLVVVKCMRAGSELDGTLAQMFLEEGRLAALLNHANVVHTYEVGQGDDGAYIVMEYLHGQALSAIQRVAKPLAPRIAARIAADALAGLHYVHELRDLDGTPLSIVHRDLSPPNIFVTHDGVVKLVDFGIAKTALATRASTEAGIVKGKLAYMAPEQTTSEMVDRRADIYAMGVVLWELLAGRRLVEDLSAVSIVRHRLHGTTPLVSSVRAEVDPALDRIVDRALRRDPGTRYATALEMREDLEEFLAQSSGVGVKQLGQLMAEHFSAQREQREHQIQSWVAAYTPEQPVALELAAGTELAAGGESTGLALLDDQRPAALPEEPPTRRAPRQSQRRLFRGAIVASMLLLALAVFVSLATQGESPDREATERAATAAMVARVTDSAPSRLEVIAHPSLASEPGAEPSSPRSIGSPPSARSVPGRRSSPTPRVPGLREVAAPAAHAPSAATASPRAAPPKANGNSELEHNPYMH
jgi:tRNA A-37 threonylcarbamoyl transferase component Bud32